MAVHGWREAMEHGMAGTEVWISLAEYSCPTLSVHIILNFRRVHPDLTAIRQPLRMLPNSC